MFRVVKIWGILLFTGMTILHAESYSQVKKVSLEVKDVSLLSVLDLIQAQSGYTFLFSSSDIEGIGGISLQVKDVEVNTVLSTCLKGTGLVFAIDQNLIVLKKQQKPQVQERRRVEGVVKNKKGEPLPGVTILIKGTNIGMVTDVNGKFQMPLVQDSVVLQFSFIGMIPREINVRIPKFGGNPEPLKVVLEESNQTLEDVVITGYGNVRKSSFTGSSTQVTGKELLKVSQGNVISALQAFDPSFRLIKNNQMGSDPNTLPEFYVRGRSGIGGISQLDQIQALEDGDVSRFALTNNPNTPVFILDGFEVDVEKVYDLDPNRISSITILKDAAATAIYGSRASNGVIVIETIAPQPGKLRITYNFNGSLTAPDLSDYNMMNAREKLEAEVLGGIFTMTSYGTEASLYEQLTTLSNHYWDKLNNIIKGVDTYWLAQPLRIEFNHKHGLYVEGGTDELRYGIELRYVNKGGVMKDSYRKNTGAGFYIDYRYKRLQIRNHFTADVLKTQNSPYGDFSDYVNAQPYEPIYDNNGVLIPAYSKLNGTRSNILNPLFEASLNSYDQSGYKDFINNLSLNWYVTSAFQIKGQIAIEYKDADTDKYIDPLSSEFNKYDKRSSGGDIGMTQKGSIERSNTKDFSWDVNILFMYNNAIGKNHLNFTLGVNTKSLNSTYSYNKYVGLAPGVDSPAFAYDNPVYSFTDNVTRLFGSFLTLNYTYDNIYLLDASFRFDGSSEFGSNKRFAPFWSFGAGINLHNYQLLKPVQWLSNFKIAANYGQTGKVNYPPYAARNTYQIVPNGGYLTGLGATLYYMGNENLVWEKTNTWNLKTEIGIIDNRVRANFSWYDKKTVDLITDVTIPSSAGFITYKDNMGEIQNRGIEMDLNLEIIRNSNLNMILFGRLAHNKNKITKISDALKAYNERVDKALNSRREDISSNYIEYKKDLRYTQSFLKYEEGSSLTSIWGMKSLGINPANGEELFLTKEGELTTVWEAAQQQILGNTEPKISGSFGLNMRWKQFTLYTTFLYDLGGQSYNQTLAGKVEDVSLINSNADKRVLTQRWSKPGDIAKYKSIKNRTLTRSTSRFVQDNNQVTFNSLTLGYDFPLRLSSRIGFSQINLQFGMNDVATFSTLKQERGLSYPFARTFNFTLNASF